MDSEGAAQRRVKRWSVTQEGAPYKVQCTCSCGFCCRDSVARSTDLRLQLPIELHNEENEM